MDPLRGQRTSAHAAGVKCLAAVVVAVVATLTLASCTSASDEDVATGGEASRGSSGPGKYEQTWSKPYGKTSCAQWKNGMDQHENFVAAADMLLGAQQVDSKDTGLPEDDLVEDFRDAITTACVVPSMALTDVAAGVYLTEKATFKP